MSKAKFSDLDFPTQNKIRAAQSSLRQSRHALSNVAISGRKIALAITKIEEAELWFNSYLEEALDGGMPK